jgi:hypothetical protein
VVKRQGAWEEWEPDLREEERRVESEEEQEQEEEGEHASAEDV